MLDASLGETTWKTDRFDECVSLISRTEQSNVQTRAINELVLRGLEERGEER